MRRLGSAAIDLCYVAAGRMDGFWESDLKPWDIAAGALIVAEAGGRVTNLDGRRVRIARRRGARDQRPPPRRDARRDRRISSWSIVSRLRPTRICSFVAASGDAWPGRLLSTAEDALDTGERHARRNCWLFVMYFAAAAGIPSARQPDRSVPMTRRLLLSHAQSGCSAVLLSRRSRRPSNRSISISGPSISQGTRRT